LEIQNFLTGYEVDIQNKSRWSGLVRGEAIRSMQRNQRQLMEVGSWQR
jgi:hypothetical protein